MHFKPLGQKLPDNITLFGRNLKYGAEAQRRSCSAIDKDYAVGTFTGRVILYFGVAEPLLELLQRDDLAVALR